MVHTIHDPRLHVTVDIAVLTVLDGELCALAIRRREPPYQGRWALPGGSVALNEDLEAAARRELRDRTGVSPGSVWLEQLATYGAPGRDPRHRTVSVAWLAVLPRPTAARGHPDAAAWKPTGRLLGRGRLAFDHRSILGDGVARTRAKLEHSNLGTAFLDAEFTIAELREVYEVVWGQPLDAGNFHRKVTRTDGFVERTGRRRSLGRGRPAEVFTVGPEQSLHPPLTRRCLE